MYFWLFLTEPVVGQWKFGRGGGGLRGNQRRPVNRTLHVRKLFAPRLHFDLESLDFSYRIWTKVRKYREDDMARTFEEFGQLKKGVDKLQAIIIIIIIFQFLEAKWQTI